MPESDELYRAIVSARFALDLLHDLRDGKPGAFWSSVETNLLDLLVIVHQQVMKPAWLTPEEGGPG